MSNKRIVKFLYFRPYLFDETTDDKEPFNFAEWIAEYKEDGKILNKVDLKDGFSARVEECRYDDKKDLWCVCFVRMRGENLPSKVAEGRAQEDLDLEEDEYIGEDMYILYDRKSNVFMMQVNRIAMTITRIAEFINKTRLQDGKYVTFSPITNIVSFNEMKRKKTRTIEISCENIQDTSKIKSGILKRICDDVMGIGCKIYAIRFSVGRSRKDELSPAESQKMIDDIINRSVNVNTAKATFQDSMTGEVEYVDLLQNKVMSRIEFELSDRERLHMNDAFNGMKKEYLSIHILKALHFDQ